MSLATVSFAVSDAITSWGVPLVVGGVGLVIAPFAYALDARSSRVHPKNAAQLNAMRASRWKREAVKIAEDWRYARRRRHAWGAAGLALIGIGLVLVILR